MGKFWGVLLGVGIGWLVFSPSGHDVLLWVGFAVVGVVASRSARRDKP